ncbi:Transposase and inactivated derivatives [Actinomyces slackii]|uniref:Transposase and inactivated derivatives n=4 Tax=Actinomyces slackii TaxID=52774 RepID=A0A3S4SSA7_9ACTO|nr:IS630 family transposase [Actinomyces slackii]VEG73822.1 Transposase and inactivated derivatives [Actinomyces slackii]VEG75486.1 Transposase and inactivated derivatives [Actinomyces slackii]
MRVDVTSDERDVLLGWKKRNDTLILVRLKAEAILYASRGVDVGVIAEMVDRCERTVKEWLADWRRTRLHSVVTGHAGNENAAKLTRTQKEQLKEVLSQPPSRSGIAADFWDVPALRDVVSARFGVEYASDSSYQLLLRLAGMSFKLPDPFDKRRDEKAITERMAQIRAEVAGLLAGGWEVYTVDEVRVEHEAETRRMWLPKGERTKIHVDRTRSAQSFFGALSLTTKKMKVYPIEGNQNAEQIILAMARLARETDNDRIAVVLDNARFHHAKALTSLYEPGEALDRITPIYLPPYAPDHNPTEHVWNTAKGHIANIQRDTPEQTWTAFTSYITSRTFDYDFEHLPITPPEGNLV